MSPKKLVDEYSGLGSPSSRHNARKKSLGICVWGGCRVKATPGRTKCAPHALIDSARVLRNYYERKNMEKLKEEQTNG